MNSPNSIYTDGGVAGKNPSVIGGSWAWIWVDENNIDMEWNCGIVTPKEIGLPAVTNNLTELLAAVEALESVPLCWKGTLYTDSKVTMHRLLGSNALVGIPQSLRLRLLEVRRNRKYKAVLIGGHPTKAQLQKGHKSNGIPVSKHNVWCDKTCQKKAEELIKEHNERQKQGIS